MSLSIDLSTLASHSARLVLCPLKRVLTVFRRTWKRVFLGYTVCQRKYNVHLRVASKSVQRLKAKLKMLFQSGKGRSIRTTIATLTPKLPYLTGLVVGFIAAHLDMLTRV
jgi:hypothetical protein